MERYFILRICFVCYWLSQDNFIQENLEVFKLSKQSLKQNGESMYIDGICC